MPGMFNASASPSKANGKDESIPLSRRKVQPLDCGRSSVYFLFMYALFNLLLSLVPVYDVRGVSIRMDAQTFDEVTTKYPRIKGEIPLGSFALIAYVAQIHKIEDNYRFFSYPLFALLYGVPKREVKKSVNTIS